MAEGYDKEVNRESRSAFTTNALRTFISVRVDIMEILTKRTLRYTDDNGDEKDLVLTIFVPFQADPLTWKCDLAFDPPIVRKPPVSEGVDFFMHWWAAFIWPAYTSTPPRLKVGFIGTEWQIAVCLGSTESAPCPKWMSLQPEC